MSEDVSATMRVGITVILVAALVATVLNLMVMSNSLLNNGQTTLQSGIDSVSEQEFATYDNAKVSGTQVSTALSLFQGRDIAIVVQTKALRSTLGNDTAVNYGALLTSDGESSTDGNKPKMMLDTSKTTKPTGVDNYGSVNTNLISDVCATAVIVKVDDQSRTTGTSVYRLSGASHLTGNLHNTSGSIDFNYDTINTTTLGNAAYILSSARFSSTLIKDQTGSIIGIYFKQIN